MDKRDDRVKAMAALNTALVEVEETMRRLNNAKSELGTAQSEHDKALLAYESKRNRVHKLTPALRNPPGASLASEPEPDFVPDPVE